LDGTIDHGLEDGVEVEGRACDRLDHIADGRFALRGTLLLAPKRGDLLDKRRIIHGSRRRKRTEEHRAPPPAGGARCRRSLGPAPWLLVKGKRSATCRRRWTTRAAR